MCGYRFGASPTRKRRTLTEDSLAAKVTAEGIAEEKAYKEPTASAAESCKSCLPLVFYPLVLYRSYSGTSL